MIKPLLSGRGGQWALRTGFLVWLVFLAAHIAVLKGHEIATLDYVSKLRESRDLDRKNIVFVSIDSEDFKDIFKSRNPLNPDEVIRAVRKIASARPALIAVDLDTTDKRYRDRENQIQFRISDFVPIVWAREARPRDEKPGSHAAFDFESPVIPGVVLGGMVTPERPFYAGTSNLFTDNGVVRRYKWAYRTSEDRMEPSFSLAVLQAMCDKHPGLEYCPLPSQCSHTDSCFEPTFIEFSMGPPHRLFSFGDLRRLPENKSANLSAWQEQLKGKIVFLGSEFAEGNDRYRSVAGEQYTVRIHAEALASQLEGETIWMSNRWLVILAELGALSVLFCAQHWLAMPVLRLWVVFFGVITLSAGLSFLAFHHWQFFINFVPLLGGVFLDAIKGWIESASPESA